MLPSCENPVKARTAVPSASAGGEAVRCRWKIMPSAVKNGPRYRGAVKETLEREVKLTPPAAFRLPELDGEPFDPRVFTSTYVDTNDMRLATAGVTLRRRVEKSRGLWQLKLPSAAARLELEVPGGPARPPAEITDLLFGLTRGKDVKPVAKLRTRRAGVNVRDGARTLAEVVVDSVSVMEDGRVRGGFRELEVELVEGDEKLLRRLEKELRRAGAEDGDPRPKVFKALGLQDGRQPPPARDAPAAEHLRAQLRRQYDEILAHDPGTRRGDDPEDLHQLRVATRRLRAFLRAGAPLLESDWADGLRAELAWLGSELGPARDLDVLLYHLRADAATLEPAELKALSRLFTRLEAERDSARAELLDGMGSERYLRLLDSLEAAADVPRFVAYGGSLPDIAAAEFRKLTKAVRELGPDPEDDELHGARIRGKRARYAAELAEPVAGKPATRVIAAAKTFQDVVGEHQDAVVAEEKIRALATGLGARGMFAAGRLVERQRGRKAAARAAFPEAWDDLRRAGRKAWT
jgi:CHAD domain-containing protein